MFYQLRAMSETKDQVFRIAALRWLQQAKAFMYLQ
jgi:hypothetical protein